MADTRTTTQQGPTPVDAATENLPAARPRTNAVAAIVPSNWQEITAMAGAICRAKMAPKSYCDQQGNPYPDKVAVAIMHGMEVGMTPMAALQSIAVINGMPSVYGDGLLALIRASGLLEDIEEHVEWDEHGPVGATCKMWRKGEKTPSVQTYTRADAIHAGLWKKPGPWSQHPARMLQWRARGWCGRDKFADVLRGLRAAEEVEDMIDVTPAGSATTDAPAPAEPKREDFQKPVEPAKTNPDPPQQAAQEPPLKDPEDDKKGAPIVTDVQDLNETASANTEEAPTQPARAPEPLVFEDFKTARAFFDFSDEWLADPKRTPDEARQWEAYYRDKLKEMANHSYERIRIATAETIKLYSAVLAKEQQG